ncbi:RagB/SusD family nutrient uptake outer membrane protein [Rhodocytophaga rosea]|uniref:RagB/SusD family nutrient uptake outer membrane protein n=1 Tax=Rhodocytophaga rosea TaxID=2704465 RepID=A0A6C0GV06_9BACT|nr:RagB/SusD family nutrient uptake outer membrane protein [Rhodocytophaga rosea]QHT71697.1 RagB/SusD family nutrient uptake outer membrane protein [Rhodocytophaga rosea]
MKNLKILFISVLLAGAGCNDFLEEDLQGQLVGTAALSSVQGLDAALTGAYKGLTQTWGTGFLHPTAIGATMGGDDVTTHPASNKQEFREFDQFAVSAGNSRTGNLYNGCYKTIQGANNILANYQNTTGDQAQIQQIVGEAYFLRALSYYWLVRLYKDIPLVTKAEFTMDMLTISKTGPDKVYELIVSDLLQAEELIQNTKRDAGRPNKGSVKALLADVYLTMAGWPLKDASKYALAAAKAKEVIDNKASYGFDLVPTFAALFDNDPTVATLPEHVFQLSAFKGVGQATNATYGFPAMPGEESGWDDYFAEVNFFNNFPAGPRKNATFRTQFKLSDGTMVPWEQSQTKHPYYGKFWIKGDVKDWASSLPFVMMRYAHVLTIYAEAKARSGGPNQQAYDALNAVRQRAGLEPLSGLSAEDFAMAVINERSWEFAAERTRWFDLVRLEMVETANASKHAWDLNPIGSITKEDYIFPLPITEVSANPNLQ